MNIIGSYVAYSFGKRSGIGVVERYKDSPEGWDIYAVHWNDGGYSAPFTYEEFKDRWDPICGSPENEQEALRLKLKYGV